MIFTTLGFPLFLAIVFAAYWLLRERRRQNLLIVVSSYVFYGWWDWRFCLLIACSSCVDFAVARAIHATDSPGKRRTLLTVGIVYSLSLLGFFKYYNFFAESLSTAAGKLGWSMHPMTLEIILPVGISFFTFQTLSYTIEVYRRRLQPASSLVEYFAFVSFFPLLLAGPIERATHLLPQFQRERTFDPVKAADGCRQILWGFFKKLAIADQLTGTVDTIYSHPATTNGGLLAIATVLFAFQIYCDFSAYSDIAIGTSRLFGFEVMRNFAYPYFSQDLGEFWRRWHISLSTWFRDYVFVPLGGSRVSTVRKVLNVITTFTISGFWHGAAWQFLAWGALNGVAVLPPTLAREQAIKRKPVDVPGGDNFIPPPLVALRMAVTFAIVCCGWVFFRADSIATACTILGKIFAAPLRENPHSWHVLMNGGPLLLVLLLVMIEWLQRRQLHPLQLEALPRPARWIVYTALLWLTFLLMPAHTSPFIYFQF